MKEYRSWPPLGHLLVAPWSFSLHGHHRVNPRGTRHCVFGKRQGQFCHHLVPRENCFFRGSGDVMSAGMPGDGLESYGGFDCWIHCLTRRIASCRLDELAYALAHSLRLEDVKYAHSFPSFPSFSSLACFSLSSRRSFILTLKLSISRRRVPSFVSFESECARDSSMVRLLLLLCPACHCSLTTARFKDGTTGPDRGASRRVVSPGDGAAAPLDSLPSVPRFDVTGSSPPMSYLESRAGEFLLSSVSISKFRGVLSFFLAWRWWWACPRPHTWW